MTPVTYTLSADDMLAGNRLAIRRHVRKGAPKFSLVVLIAAVAVTLIVYGLNPQPFAAVAELFGKIMALYVGVAVVLTLFVLVVTPGQRARKNMAQVPALSRPQTVKWDETSISFASDYGHAVIPLTELHQWAANDALLILFPADHIFHLIPKRYIEDQSAWDRLIAAITQAGIKKI